MTPGPTITWTHSQEESSLAFAGACLDVYKMARGLTTKPFGLKRISYEIRILVVATGGVVLGNAAVAAAGGTLLFLGVNWLLHAHQPDCVSAAIGRPDPWRFQLTLGPSMILAVSFMSLVLGAGLIGRDFRDWLREWGACGLGLCCSAFSGQVPRRLLGLVGVAITEPSFR